MPTLADAVRSGLVGGGGESESEEAELVSAARSLGMATAEEAGCTEAREDATKGAGSVGAAS